MNTTEREQAGQKIQEALKDYSAIGLKEMEEGHLLSRFDKKYVFSIERLPDFLQQLKSDYKVLTVSGLSVSHYSNLYFDTPELKSYLDHHNQRAGRYKIRFRTYENTDECFLELKMKNNKGRTQKERLKSVVVKQLNSSHVDFIKKHLVQPGNLIPQVANRFSRITLVNVEERERVTIDFLLHFQNNGSEKYIDELVIAEVKQESPHSVSSFKKLMKAERIFPTGISKYVLGTILTHRGVKINGFKAKLISLNKICHGVV